MEKSSVSTIFKSVILGVLFSAIIFLLLTLIHAFILNTFSLSTSMVKPINQFIKGISLFLGGIVFIGENKGLVKGLFLGFISSLLLIILTAIFGGKITFLSALFEIVFLSVIGAISGSVAVNLKR